MNIFNFFTEQVLGMKWLSDLITLFVENVLNLDVASRMGGSIQFFIYDTIKIFILLGVLIFFISYIQSYFPPERTKRILTKFKGISGATISALLGTVTPFCSCSSIPIFIGFSNAGLPLGVTFSFLISSPMVDIASLLLLAGFFGMNVSILYVVLGLIIAIIGGTIISKLNLESEIQTYTEHTRELYDESEGFNQKQRLNYAKEDTIAIVKNVYKYVLIGVGIGALIHNWIPQEAILAVLGHDNPFSVIIATVIGIPMYADIFGTIPIAEALFMAGVPIGTVLAFMMGVTALSLPSMIMLSKVVKPKLLAIFIGIVTVGIIITGYLFNAIGPFLM
ncbi:MAG: permease [Paraclostridium bifermentans]|uniref:permease n=1 Tax=Paraclostridium bifermentans TaxID=1490 RepID=UPI00241E842F|nr:permease [Paraclostridium bifermentans]MBS5953507.1 permease [Paraclostridium bifermentans]